MPAAVNSKPIPRQRQRRSSMSMLPRSAEMFMTSGYSAQTRSVGGAGSATEHHHARPDVLLGRVDDPAREHLQAGGAALGLDLRERDAVQREHVVAGAARPVGAHDRPDALDRDAVA